MSQWQALSTKHAELSMREKVLILASAIVVIVLLSVHLVIEPQMDSLKSNKKTSQRLNNNIQETVNGRKEIERKIASDPKGKLTRELASLNEHNAKLDKALAKQQLALISSDEMVLELQSLVSEQKGLTVEKLTSLPPTAILHEQTADESAQGKPLLYRHSIEIQVKGSYFEVVNFFRYIEEQNEFLLWGDIHYEVAEYPEALVTFVVSTVSMDREFIGVK